MVLGPHALIDYHFIVKIKKINTENLRYLYGIILRIEWCDRSYAALINQFRESDVQLIMFLQNRTFYLHKQAALAIGTNFRFEWFEIPCQLQKHP